MSKQSKNKFSEKGPDIGPSDELVKSESLSAASNEVANEQAQSEASQPEIIKEAEKADEVKEKKEAQPEVKKQRLALFYKRFVLSRPIENIAKSYNKIFDAKTFVTDDAIIDELIEKNAPIGIFERVN